MRTVLKTALFLEIAAGAFWTFSLAMIKGPGGLEVLGLFVLIYSIQAICLLVGLWAYWRHADVRRTAGWLLALPFVFLFLPGIVKNLAGGHLTESGFAALLLIAVTVILIVCFLMPRKVADKLPDFLFRSRLVNGLILSGLVLGWLFFAGILAWVFGVEGEQTARSLRGDATGYGLASMIVMTTLYLTALGGASLLSGAWAWMSLHSGIQGACRKLNLAQVVVATPGILIGGFAVFFVLGQN